MPATAPFSVQCPSCESWFPIDPERVPDGGVPAICSNCQRVFRVEVPEAGAPSPEVEGREAEEASPEAASREEAADARTAEPEVPGTEEEGSLQIDEETAAEAETEVEVGEEAEVEESSEPEAAPSPVEEHSLSAAASRFGRRDPHDRARRLARVLVSDMLTYHPARYEKALAEGTLREDFEEEIRLSWEEYEEQIGGEIAESTDYFIRALNEILARGTTLFRGSGRPT